MRASLARSAFVLAIFGGLLACAPIETGEHPDPVIPPVPFSPEYLGVQTRLLEGDLVSFLISMKGARDNQDVAAYGECAAAQYALIRGYGFARHVRTQVELQGSIWRGDAGYVISAALPDGLRTIDAEITVQACIENAIPTV